MFYKIVIIEAHKSLLEDKNNKKNETDVWRRIVR